MALPDSTFRFSAEDSPGLLLWQTTVTWQRLIKKAISPFGVSHAQFVILAILLWSEESHDEPSQRFIADQSKLDKMTVSKSLKSLASQGLVRRSEHEDDSRANAVTLTDKGRRIAQKLVPLVENVDARFFTELTPSRRSHLIRLLQTIVAHT